MAAGTAALTPAPGMPQLAPAETVSGALPGILPDGAVTDHVVVISIDGLRPDAIERFGAKVLLRLMSEGSYSLEARTISPSKTLPSHTSMLTGVPPTVHGITWNDDRTRRLGMVDSETVFEAAKREGFTTAAFFSKTKMNHLRKAGTLDHVFVPSGGSAYSAAEMVDATTRYLHFRTPNLLFVHLAEPDAAGHSFGWMSAPYGWAVRRADGAVGRILAAADEAYGAGNYTVIVTADHGGHGRTHSHETEVDVQIPWITWGEGVQDGGPVERPVSTMDTAATVLWLLGLQESDAMQGIAVAAAYTPAARLAASNAVAPR